MPGARAVGGVVGGYRPDQEAGCRAACGPGPPMIHTRSLRAGQFHVTPGGDSGIRPPGPLRLCRLSGDLLATKALAARLRSAEDIRQLAQVLGLHTVDDVLASLCEIFPKRSH